MSKEIFNSIQLPNVDSNYFDLTHDVKLSTQMGRLTPVMCMEVLPGDKVNLQAEMIVRMAPMVAPVMHKLDAFVHYFFVPNRLLWDNWETFITGDNEQGPAGPQPAPAFPYLRLNSGGGHAAPGTLANYLGVPEPASSSGHHISILPFVAYQKIYNDWYRDENLIQEFDLTIADGNNGNLGVNPTFSDLRYRAWEHDYFTSALPWAQKGQAVTIPTTFDDAIVKFNDGNPGGPGADFANTSLGSPFPISHTDSGTSNNPVVQPAMLYAEMGSVTQNTTINDLRKAIALQEFLERNARGGTRYVEHLKAHFNVNSSDARLQQAEYITGTKAPIIISEILNTSGADIGTNPLPQGNMAGHGISYTSGRAGGYYAEEHGYILGILSILPRTAYQQGLPKHFSKFDRLDYAYPEFAHLGEQEVLMKELYIDATDPDSVFGYLPRYAEYKDMPSRVAGQFQTTLDYWHLGRIFATDPALNEDFITCKPEDRIFADTNPADDKFYVHMVNHVGAVRKLPKFGTPSF